MWQVKMVFCHLGAFRFFQKCMKMLDLLRFTQYDERHALLYDGVGGWIVRELVLTHETGDDQKPSSLSDVRLRKGLTDHPVPFVNHHFLEADLVL